MTHGENQSCSIGTREVRSDNFPSANNPSANFKNHSHSDQISVAGFFLRRLFSRVASDENRSCSTGTREVRPDNFPSADNSPANFKNHSHSDQIKTAGFYSCGFYLVSVALFTPAVFAGPNHSGPRCSQKPKPPKAGSRQSRVYRGDRRRPCDGGEVTGSC